MYVYIIRNYPSTEELITYAKTNYNTCGGITRIAAEDNQQDTIVVDFGFSNSEVHLKTTMPGGNKKEYSIKYKLIDSILRDYIRNHISHTETIEILEGDKNEDN